MTWPDRKQRDQSKAPMTSANDSPLLLISPVSSFGIVRTSNWFKPVSHSPRQFRYLLIPFAIDPIGPTSLYCNSAVAIETNSKWVNFVGKVQLLAVAKELSRDDQLLGPVS